MIPGPGRRPASGGGNTGHEEAIAELIERHGPMSSWGPDALAEVFLHDVDPGVARDNERYQGVPGDGMFAEPWPLESWPDVATHVLAPTEDRLFPREFQRRIARERLELEIDEIPGGHKPPAARLAELEQRHE
jgi:hypothetical protein